MAPAADLAVASVSTPADLQAAVTWFVGQGVDVILRTDTGFFDSPGDGTGATNAALDGAVAQGISVVQAVGNAGNGEGGGPGGYYRWTYADADADGWLEFAPDDERLSIVTCGALSGLRWDDFGEGADTTDYDLHIFNSGQTGDFGYHRSELRQSALVPPIEAAFACDYGVEEIGVRVFGSVDARKATSWSSWATA